MIRILHTADWHLGHTLGSHSRTHEHAAFLAWLLDILESEQVDALIHAGDVFDTPNPSAEAQALWYRFLADAHARMPALDMVITGGNHDSPSRLEAPRPLLDAFRVHVVGTLPRGADGMPDADRIIVPIHDKDGAVAARVAAVPFLRPADLPTLSPPEGGDPLIEGVRAVYAHVIDRARDARTDGESLLATGHCYMVGTTLSELSERRILGGNQHALPADIFPDDVTYAALGHLHRPQRVGPSGRIRYSGSPIPLSLPESAYAHEVRIVDLDGDRIVAEKGLRIPRTVDVVHVPRTGSAPITEVTAALRALPDAGSMPRERWPYLEARVLLDAPDPDVRRLIEEALASKAARLVRLGVDTTGTGAGLADAVPHVTLGELQPEDVFRRCHARAFDSEPTPALMEAFHAVVARAHEEEAT